MSENKGMSAPSTSTNSTSSDHEAPVKINRKRIMNATQMSTGEEGPVSKRANPNEQSEAINLDEDEGDSHLLHGGKVPCPDCSKTFDNRKRLRQHKYTVHAPKTHVCDECSKSFPSPFTLQRHRRAHEDKRPLPDGIQFNIEVPKPPEEAFRIRPDGRYSETYAFVPDVYSDEPPWVDRPHEPYDSEAIVTAFTILKAESWNKRAIMKLKVDALYRFWHVCYSVYLLKSAGDPTCFEELLHKLRQQFPVEGISASSSLQKPYMIFFSKDRIQYLPSNLLGPTTADGHYTPSRDVIDFYCQTAMYARPGAAKYADPRGSGLPHINGRTIRAMVRWAKVAVASSVEEIPVPDGPFQNPWKYAPTDFVRSIIDNQLRDYPSLRRMLIDHDYYEAHLKRALKLIRRSNEPTTDPKKLGELYVKHEEADGKSPHDLLMCACYGGLTSPWYAVGRDYKHKNNVRKALQSNSRKYQIFHQSLSNGRNLRSFNLMVNCGPMSRETAHLAEVALIASLQILTPSLNAQGGNTRLITCPIGKCLPLLVLQEVGLALLLEGWQTSIQGAAALVDPWMTATATPPEGRIAPLRHPIRLQAVEQLETSEEQDEDDEEEQDEEDAAEGDVF